MDLELEEDFTRERMAWGEGGRQREKCERKWKGLKVGFV